MFDTVFIVALQSCFILGLIHGINPCGHSWLILAPFVYGEESGRRVFTLTTAFIAGTTLACLAIGVTLGSISMMLPQGIQHIVDITTTIILVILGGILIIKPQWLHSHDHHDNHSHGDDHHTCHHDSHTHSANSHHHTHSHGSCKCSSKFSLKNASVWGLFTIGFMNMIVPCPTVAIMYSYALDSGSALKATMVFASYALGTGIALAGVIYAIYKVTSMMRTLNQHWIEPLVMRTAGVMTIIFAIYSYLSDTNIV